MEGGDIIEIHVKSPNYRYVDVTKTLAKLQISLKLGSGKRWMKRKMSVFPHPAITPEQADIRLEINPPAKPGVRRPVAMFFLVLYSLVN